MRRVVWGCLAAMALAGCNTTGFGVGGAEPITNAKPPAQDGTREIDYSYVRREMYVTYPHTGVIMLGDSLTEQNVWIESLRCVVSNRGISGDTSADVLARLPEIIAEKPRTVFLHIGINDFVKNTSQNLPKNVVAIVQTLEKAGTKVYWIPIFPIASFAPNFAEVNKVIAKTNDTIAKKLKPEQIIKVDLPADGPDLRYDTIHLRAKAYVRWADAIREKACEQK